MGQPEIKWVNYPPEDVRTAHALCRGLFVALLQRDPLAVNFEMDLSHPVEKFFIHTMGMLLERTPHLNEMMEAGSDRFMVEGVQHYFATQGGKAPNERRNIHS